MSENFCFDAQAQTVDNVNPTNPSGPNKATSMHDAARVCLVLNWTHGTLASAHEPRAATRHGRRSHRALHCLLAGMVYSGGRGRIERGQDQPA